MGFWKNQIQKNSHSWANRKIRFKRISIHGFLKIFVSKINIHCVNKEKLDQKLIIIVLGYSSFRLNDIWSPLLCQGHKKYTCMHMLEIHFGTASNTLKHGYVLTSARHKVLNWQDYIHFETSKFREYTSPGIQENRVEHELQQISQKDEPNKYKLHEESTSANSSYKPQM